MANPDQLELKAILSESMNIFLEENFKSSGSEYMPTLHEAMDVLRAYNKIILERDENNETEKRGTG